MAVGESGGGGAGADLGGEVGGVAANPIARDVGGAGHTGGEAEA
ncbi:hypothetical protein [Streptomyces sp. NPDC001275]